MVIKILSNDDGSHKRALRALLDGFSLKIQKQLHRASECNIDQLDFLEIFKRLRHKNPFFVANIHYQRHKA